MELVEIGALQVVVFLFSFSGMDYDTGIGREWLVPNGIGGYASSTIIAANSRKYHGLLVSAMDPPLGRRVLLAGIDETLRFGCESLELSVHKYPDTVYPQGFLHLSSFRMENFPTFIYETSGLRVEKTVFMEHGANAVFIEYSVVNPESIECEILLRPMVTNRDFHTTRRREDYNFETLTSEARCEVFDRENIVLGLASDKAVFLKDESWYYNVEYDHDRVRGLDYQEDIYSPGYFTLSLRSGASFSIAASTPAYGYDTSALKDACRSWREIKEGEIVRRKKLVERAGVTSVFGEKLVLAADTFIVQRNGGKSVLAGYHWFSDWARDAMISLTGLTLVTKRFKDARGVLSTFAKNTVEGLMPNRFIETGGGREYGGADAPLWFIHASGEYLKQTMDSKFVRERLWKTIKSIISWYRKGTRGVHSDYDGLIVSSSHMTWMDAKIGDWIVTPREGKACEINALWYNALRIAEEMARLFGDEDNESTYHELAEIVRESYSKFWNETEECLFDVLSEDGADDSIRPNQIFAASLPHRPISIEKGRRIVDVVERVLFTPFGLRTLSPSSPDYRGRYEGDVVSRDSAYHQGTVWPWLLGHFITAYLNTHGRNEQSLKQMRRLLSPFEEHLSDAGLGSISEVFDGDPPQRPGGCAFQAWSVAEILRAYKELR
ncbi:MAG: amylo-alpha-1,6-glucosidase [Methanosarcinales archaeon]